MTAETSTDPLWSEFKPLWNDLHQAGKSFLVAGGYGLFLKQRWLLEQPDARIAVPLARWRDAAPRVTKDMDLIVGLDLLADETAQRVMREALDRNKFKAGSDDFSKYWQFEKQVGDRTMLVELHARVPDDGLTGIDVRDAFRVKHNPRLGAKGVHGRKNPEAIGSELHGFRFVLEGVEIAVPNPVTMCVMKLVALRDRWRRADDPARDEKNRSFSRVQAIKHAQDIYRTVALTEASEREGVDVVLRTIAGSAEFATAQEVFKQYFGDELGRGRQSVSEAWLEDDALVIHEILRGWFASDPSVAVRLAGSAKRLGQH